MKVRVTAKQIKSSFSNIICIGYCDLSYLLDKFNANYYTCGVYGWNSDIHIINNNTCVVTGYRPFGNIRPNYETVRKYNKAAEKINSWENKNSYENKKKQLEKLLNDFIKEVTQK